MFNITNMTDLLFFITTNKNKANEAQEILNIPIEIVSIELDEIQSLDLKKIARKKTEEAYKILKKPLIIDDVSMHIEVWNGFPGPFTKFIHEAGGSELLLRMLKGEKNRNAVVTATIGYHDGKQIHIFQGSVKGKIAKKSLGSNGFGWDSVFIPEGTGKTYAQMEIIEKNNLSHRKKALEEFKKFLSSSSQ